MCYITRFIKYTGDPTDTGSLHPPAGTVSDQESSEEVQTPMPAHLQRSFPQQMSLFRPSVAQQNVPSSWENCCPTVHVAS